jgi:hypothetical protein
LAGKTVQFHSDIPEREAVEMQKLDHVTLEQNFSVLHDFRRRFARHFFQGRSKIFV